MDIKIEQFKNILNNNKDKKILAIFHAEWCPYCLKNVPEIKEFLKHHKVDNYYFVDIGDEYNDVWKETGNTEWALELVPTTRIYLNNKVVFEHTNVVNEQTFLKIINEFNA